MFSRLPYYLIALLTVAAWFGPDPSVLAKTPDRPDQKALQAYVQWQEAGNPDAQGKNVSLTSQFPDPDWWQSFNDPHLNTYIKDALANNPGVNAARTRVEEARAQAREDFATLLPSVSLAPSITRYKLPSSLGSALPVPDPLKIYQMPLSASWEVDLFGKNIDKVKSANRQTEATLWDSRTADLMLESDVAGAYFNLLRADHSVATQTQNVDLLSRIVVLKQNQHQLGVLSYDEVIRTNRDLAQAQSDLASDKKEQALFAHQLSVLTGDTPKSADNLERGRLEDLSLPDKVNAGIPSALVTRRPDVVASEKRLDAAGIDVREARKEFLPTINLSAALSFISLKGSNWLSSANLINDEAGSITQGLFKGGAVLAHFHLSKARYQEAIDNYRQTVLNAFKDAEDGISQLQAANQNMTDDSQRLALTAKDVQLQQDLYQHGLIAKLDVLQSQSEEIRYEQQASDSKADALIALVGLYKALGGGF